MNATGIGSLPVWEADALRARGAGVHMPSETPRTPARPETDALRAVVARERAQRDDRMAYLTSRRAELTEDALRATREQIDMAYAGALRDSAALHARLAAARHAQGVKALAEAQAKADSSRNWAKVQALTAEVSAQLATAPETGMGSAGRTPTDVLTRLGDTYRQAGDHDALRALRTAGAQVAAKNPDLLAAWREDECAALGDDGRKALEAQADARQDLHSVYTLTMTAAAEVAPIGGAMALADSIVRDYVHLLTPDLPGDAQA